MQTTGDEARTRRKALASAVLAVVVGGVIGALAGADGGQGMVDHETSMMPTVTPYATGSGVTPGPSK
jgi:hypothetical protein